MPFPLPPLPFAEDALTPFLSAETFEYHYGEHHKGYVDALNALIDGTPEASKTLEELVCTTRGPLFNNAAQTWNHTFFWSCLSPDVRAPGAMVENALTTAFGSLDAFRQHFKDRALTLFGSGWVWLVHDKNGELAITQGRNADNPLRYGATPLLTCDVWEHAYYIDYRNDRGRFVDAFWSAVDWSVVERQLRLARDGGHQHIAE